MKLGFPWDIPGPQKLRLMCGEFIIVVNSLYKFPLVELTKRVESLRTQAVQSFLAAVFDQRTILFV